jgi:hypothetical protein
LGSLTGGERASPGLRPSLRCRGLAGIDIVVEATGLRLKYSFELRPGADVGRIRLACDGTTALHLKDGALLLETPLGSLVDAAPIAWQDTAAERRAIEARYLVDAEGSVGFDVACFDPDLPLILDPAIIAYATSVSLRG